MLKLLAQSLTAAAIGRRLMISTTTVHKHLARVYRKLGTDDRQATVLHAQQFGLVAVDKCRSSHPNEPARRAVRRTQD